ncbi:Pseudouridine synthase [Nostocoides japonicum T1-X7]|uniref:Pseudouridine synthase n=1 Tax=Nostocoides japonicum T1-X7 TaxID=1194083 RepID=A0A077M129_9MICO|nr:pseudouridine synthase [Tetrasphaera japonica]CCH77894.1 Pseudouridine synthase [Tetrasphaera japonica T1-X7]
MTPPRRREGRPPQDPGAGRPPKGSGTGRTSKGSGTGRGGQGHPQPSPTGRPPRPHRPNDPSRKGAKGRAAQPPVDVHDADGIRLQKVLAAAGIGSRRACEELIVQGRVEVDGHVVTELGVRVDPARHVIAVDGERVQTDTSRVYLAFNKPYNVVTSMNDELGRIDISSYLGERNARLFHVGRLDADTEGLLLLTNDGELANRLQHPQYGVPKTYLAEVPGPVPRDLGRRLRAGVELDDGPVAVDSFRLVDSKPGKAIVEVVIHEGRKHIVRRLLEAVGHPVVHLVRTQVGPIRLGDTKAGKWRALTAAEVSALYRAAGL